MTPFFSIIVPVYNGAMTLDRCLASIVGSTFADFELIVVDDGSLDVSAEIAAQYTPHVLHSPQRSGPAYARNIGVAQAQGDYLFFTDADCELHAETLSLLATHCRNNPQFDAVIGSYDDAPDAPNFTSQYKNLLHHFTHQTSGNRVHTFWTGCGAIKRERFDALGGFDAVRYPSASIEDIEMGYRLTQMGGRIALAPHIQVKHLKRWELVAMLKSDIFDRALPWSELLLTTQDNFGDLNVQHSQRLSVVLIYLLPFMRRWGWLNVVGVAVLNRKLYQFFLRQGGWGFAMRALLLHALYFVYSGAVFGYVLVRTRMFR